MKILTGNDLVSGDVIWWAGDGWSRQVGDSVDVGEQALERGVYAQGIRYPSVPEQAARLRFTPMCSHTAAEIETVVEIFRELR